MPEVLDYVLSITLFVMTPQGPTRVEMFKPAKDFQACTQAGTNVIFEVAAWPPHVPRKVQLECLPKTKWLAKTGKPV